VSGSITRRQVLKQIAATGVFAPAILTTWRGHAFAALPPLPNLSPADGQLLLPNSSGFNANNSIYNQRTLLRPELRAMCKTPNGVAAMVDWARTNKLPFTSRSGGHSYEGFSQTTGVVIDTRPMNNVAITGDTATIGAGASLGEVYTQIARKGFALPAGSCPTVGISGHVLGGGFGFLGRPFGLACDSLEWIELVNAQGQLIQADAQQNPDLFWACRGGGGGSFGIATRFRFKLHQVPQVVIFSIDWTVNAASAAKIMKAWQAWAPQAPKTITSILRLGKRQNGRINVHCAGQSVGSVAEVKKELGHLPNAVPSISGPHTFQWVVTNIYHPGQSTPPIYFKCKSDYVVSPMSDDGIATLIAGLSKLPADAIVPICDAYGGAVADVASDATAFPHRAGTLYCIQYYSAWTKAADTQRRVKYLQDFYASMRPYVSGAAYVNYCDLDLPDWANAYWGSNLPRLRQIKAAFDPDNLFRQAQSIPLPA
jgi:FAD/FMN-containing dehydrogenase